MSILVLLFAAATVAQACHGCPAGVPISIGEPLDIARAAIVHNGWKPVRLPPPRGDLSADLDYPERQMCSWGQQFCLFNYAKAGRCLQVETKGEYVRRIEWWSYRCPSN